MSIPVLVIDDEVRHCEQVSEALSSDGYTCTTFQEPDIEKIFDYKARHRDNQLVVVDLNLDNKEEFDSGEGLDFIREKLWPVDRNTLFVVFSRYLDEDRTGPSVFNRVEPHWVWVAKVTEPGTGELTVDCLKNLRIIIGRCREVISPSLETPSYDLYRYSQTLEEFLEDRPLKERHRYVKECLARSVNVLNRLSLVCSTFCRAGYASIDFAVGVYGSCGRLEMRKTSDIEMSVYVRSDSQLTGVSRREIYGPLAVGFWNHLFENCERDGPECEGRKLVEGNSPKRLRVSQIGERRVDQNEYVPIIDMTDVFDAVPHKRPSIRNRHVQILSELRPVFNPKVICEFKRELLLRSLKSPSLDCLSLFGSQYWREIIDQFWLDSRPDSLTDDVGIKRFCYRTLNLLALKLCLIRLIEFRQDARVESLDQWSRIFDELCEPGIVKVARFGNQYRVSTSKKDTIIKKCDAVIESYCSLISRFDTGLRATREIVGLVRSFQELFEVAANSRMFREAQEASWLFSTETVGKWIEEVR